MKLSKIIKLAKRNNTYDRVYGEFVNKQVRATYSESDEIALLRKEIALLKKEIELLKGESAPVNEFDQYNDYVEGCKTDVKAELGGAE